MTVRAKMQCQSIVKGVVGASFSFGAVWEGSTELQEVSENAIFGRASPAGTAQLSGKLDPDRFEKDEEYYFDFYATHGSERAPPVDDLVLASIPISKSFRGGWNHSDIPMAQFTFVARHGDVYTQLGITIANPAATAYLDDGDDYTLVVRKAFGRRSDAEIALRQKQVDEVKAQMEKANNPDSFKSWLWACERKLARAEGKP